MYWLFKSEPGSYSIDHLARDGTTFWNGVRNYQARNFMRDEMQPGDGVLFYHSNTDPPGVAGLAHVTRAGYPDPTARDPQSNYFDAKATDGDPRWFMVDIAFDEAFPAIVPLARLRDVPALAGMPLLNKSRLSIQPITADEWATIVALGRAGAA